MTDHKFQRDLTSNGGAVVNTDTEALLAYRRRKAALREKDRQIETLTTRLNKVEELLTKLLESH